MALSLSTHLAAAALAGAQPAPRRKQSAAGSASPPAAHHCHWPAQRVRQGARTSGCACDAHIRVEECRASWAGVGNECVGAACVCIVRLIGTHHAQGLVGGLAVLADGGQVLKWLLSLVAPQLLWHQGVHVRQAVIRSVPHPEGVAWCVDGFGGVGAEPAQVSPAKEGLRGAQVLRPWHRCGRTSLLRAP
eukprot:CAMPEP_0202887206 /NCGR_PEP_ID=MMETSP1391-20130828/42566_1 /ASSEMBLY_ACC=CAM_ASM_000867 /TAXON_ID=1034604 /ORGANISM="Chlamydomonas leiostraca, Strain SAG 11-49" /LENGTH=189 /DNA_ID=CAMNT_0049570487 /DNA_START=837 /DNA_END=1407 /DNA_ORIENTATION=+